MHPTLFHLGPLYLPTFGLLAALGLVMALYVSLHTATLCRLPPETLWNAGLVSVGVAFLASRLLLIAFNLRSFMAAPFLLLAVPSLTALGLLVTLLATLFYLRWKRLPVLRTLDAWTPPAMLLWAFLACGHLAEGSDPGLPAPWGLRTSLAGYREQPVALYAALLALVFAAVLYLRLRGDAAPGETTALGLMLAGVSQFLLTFARLPYRYDGITPLATLDPIQWIAFAMLTSGCALWVAARTLTTQPPAHRIPGNRE